MNRACTIIYRSLAFNYKIVKQVFWKTHKTAKLENGYKSDGAVFKNHSKKRAMIIDITLNMTPQ